MKLMDFNEFIGRSSSHFLENFQFNLTLAVKELDGVEYVFGIYPSKDVAKKVLNDEKEEFKYLSSILTPDTLD